MKLQVGTLRKIHLSHIVRRSSALAYRCGEPLATNLARVLSHRSSAEALASPLCMYSTRAVPRTPVWGVIPVLGCGVVRSVPVQGRKCRIAGTFRRTGCLMSNYRPAE